VPSLRYRTARRVSSSRSSIRSFSATTGSSPRTSSTNRSAFADFPLGDAFEKDVVDDGVGDQRAADRCSSTKLSVAIRPQ
jgi:hypothetical protein